MTAAKISAQQPTFAHVTIGSARRTVVSPEATRLTRMNTMPDVLCSSAPVSIPTMPDSHRFWVIRPTAVRRRRPVACLRFPSISRSPLKNRPRLAMTFARMELSMRVAGPNHTVGLLASCDDGVNDWTQDARGRCWRLQVTQAALPNDVAVGVIDGDGAVR